MASITLGVGKGALLTAKDIEQAALSLKCHPATIEAITQVESAGSGYFSLSEDKLRRIKILPEPHVFGDKLPTALIKKALEVGLAYENYKVTKASGHYKRMGPAKARYDFFARMIDFKQSTAYLSISSGKFQIMGFNFESCGWKDAQKMFEDFCESEAYQLKAFLGFMATNNLVNAMQTENYARIEKVYNGGGLNGVYANRMKAAAAVLRAKQWKNWTPNNPIPVVKIDKLLTKKEYPGLLEMGDSGQAVADLQIKLGITHGDGMFGPKTREAVIEFQKKNNIVADGIVGRVTHEALWK
jgi:peptidoglycan hydrolase-like protein with peptidoglycan-binding domain